MMPLTTARATVYLELGSASGGCVLFGPIRREPIRFFEKNCDMNAFANLPNLAAIAKIEKTSVKIAVSGIMLSRGFGAIGVNKASS
jgi:hypothetical protein